MNLSHDEIQEFVNGNVIVVVIPSRPSIKVLVNEETDKRVR